MKKYRIKETGVELVKIEEHVDPAQDIFSPVNSDKWYRATEFPELGLTLETIEEVKPEVKKLYAFLNLVENEVRFYRSQESGNQYVSNRRSPEYDITYSVGEK